MIIIPIIDVVVTNLTSCKKWLKRTGCISSESGVVFQGKTGVFRVEIQALL